MAVSGRYWRIRATAPSYYGGNIIQINEAEFYESADLTGTKVSISSASASSIYNANYSADKATDGSTITRWNSQYPYTSNYEWWCADFGSSKTICSFRLHLRDGDSSGRTPEEFVIEASYDNSDWTIVNTFNPDNPVSTMWVNFEEIQDLATGHFPMLDGFGRSGELLS